MRLIIGMSGASGVIYGIRLLEVLSQVVEKGHKVIMEHGMVVNTKLADCLLFLMVRG